MMASVLSDVALEALLREDVPYADLTTEALGIGERAGSISFKSRAPMVVCGTEEATRLFALCGAEATLRAPSGTRLGAGGELLEAQGRAAALLGAWKVAQSLVEWTSGIASASSRLVAAVRDAGCSSTVACTRKAFPGTRWLASKAVLAGGATLHRLGLSESVLVFPEHRAFLSELEPARQWLAALRSRERERRLTIEVTSVEQALHFAEAGAEALQLEHLSPAAVAQCRAGLQQLGLRPLLLAAGGVNEHNAADYARAGADVLVSSAPYQARPLDVQVLVRALPAHRP